MIVAGLLFFSSQIAHSYMIPFAFWKTSATPDPCAPGVTYNGKCYYLGTLGADCYATCSGYGGCLRDDTQTVASTGSVCLSVLQSLKQNPATGSPGTNYYTYACALSGTQYVYDNGLISCGATDASSQRVCACGAGGSTQAGAATMDGYYYRLGAANASCDTTCTGHGGCNLAGTQNAATSSSKCTSVLTALDKATSGTGSGSTSVGCGAQNITTPFPFTATYLGSNPATCAATLTAVQRACACNSP